MTNDPTAVTGEAGDVDIQIACALADVPGEDDLRRWAEKVLNAEDGTGELVIRIVDEAEGRALNHRYRGKDYATNVLSFPFEPPPGLDVAVLGDLVICAPVVAREAREQDKSVDGHWAHMVIHGILHLLGYDHIKDGEAERMEHLETRLLAGLGHADPYHARGDSEPFTRA